MTTILVIDDEPENLELIRRFLERTDYQILTARHGAEGWVLLMQHADTVKVILLDQMMPVMTGMEFLAKLQQEPSFAHLPVIMQTAVPRSVLDIEGKLPHVFSYVTKPFSKKELLTHIQAALNQRDPDVCRVTSNLPSPTSCTY